MNKKSFHQKSNHAHNSDQVERTLQDIRNNLNNEYPKFLKAVYSTRLTQQEKKEKTIEFICLLEELANTIKDR